MSKDDVTLSIILAIVVLTLFVLFYTRYSQSHLMKPSHRPRCKDRPVQYADCLFDGYHDCAWYANDGRTADFEPDYFLRSPPCGSAKSSRP
jgi:hypothetical protein